MNRWLVPLAAVIALPGCTNDTPVTVSQVDGRIVFVFPQSVSCVDYLSLTDAKQATVWTAGNGADGNRPCVPMAENRVVYGVALAGMATIEPPRALVTGRSYALIGSPGVLRAAFRYNGRGTQPTNFAPNTTEWCAVQYPGTTRDWTGQCVLR